MTILASLHEAAFWEARVCLGCGKVEEEFIDGVHNCEACDGKLADAKSLVGFLALLEAENEE